jgi:hypothetical protein
MIRAISLAVTVLLLCGCEAKQVERVQALLTGDPQALVEPGFTVLAGEAEAVVVPVIEPEPVPDCTPTLWRAVWTNPCTGETWEID